MRRQRQGKAGADSDPARWPVSRLLAFLAEHAVDAPAPPVEKSELVKLVRDAMDDLLLAGSDPDDTAPPSHTDPLQEVVDPATKTTEELALYASHVNYATHLRQNPLQLVQLLNKVWAAHPHRGNGAHPVCQWISDVLTGLDGSSVMMSALVTETNAVCGRHLTRNDVAFKCLDCSADPTCIICAECFKTSPCQNHEYRMIRSGGGMCDCGDPTAWKKEGFCARHRGISEADDPSTSVPSSAAAWLFPCLRASIRVLLSAVQKFLIGNKDKPASQWVVLNDQVEVLVTTVAQQLSRLAQFSDCARRVVVKLLLECRERDELELTNNNALIAEAAASSSTTLSAMEMLFLLDQRIHWATVRNRSLVKGLRWWQPVISIVKQCVADPFCKIPLCRILLKYREISIADQLGRALDDEEDEEQESSTRAVEDMMTLAVQVFTVPTVVEPLLNPKKLMLGDSCTILDRLMVSVLYGFVAVRDKRGSAFPVLEPASFSDIAMKINPSTKEADVFTIVHLLVELKYALKASPAARAYFAMSAVLNKALAAVCRIVSNSGWIRRDPDAVGHILPWHVEGRLMTLTGIVLAGCRQSIKRLLVHGAVKAQPPELSNALALFQEVKHKTLTSIAFVAGEWTRPLPLKVDLDMGLAQHVTLPADVSGSFAHCSNAEALLQALLSIYAPQAADLALAMKRASTNRQHTLQGDPMTFTIPAMRAVAGIVRLALELHQQPNTADASGISVVADSTGVANLLRRFIPTAIEGLAWLTLLLQPFVVRAQHEQQLWKRDFMKVGHQLDLYERLWKGYTQENDVALSQLLTCAIPPEAFANEVLIRFSYTPQADRLNKKGVPVGFAPFLRHILTTSLDHSKLGRAVLQSDHSQHSYLQHVLRVMLLAHAAGLPRSSIQRELKSYLCNDDEDDDDDGAEGELSDAVVTRCLQEIATAEQRRDGLWYRLKNVDQFSLVNPFSCHLESSSQQLALWSSFSKSAATAKLPDDAMVESAPGHLLLTAGGSAPFALHSAVLSSARRLLHATATLNTAAFLVICAAQYEHDDVPKATDDDIFVAVDTLAAACSDSVRLSNTLSGVDNQIRWDTVEAVIAADGATQQPVAVLPLPELKSAHGVKNVLTTLVSKCDLSIIARSSAHKFPSPMTPAAALLELREWLLQSVGHKANNPASPLKGGSSHPCDPMRREKKLVLLYRISTVLRAIGALAVEVVSECTIVDAGPAPSQSEKILRAKQRQKELMEKMKSKQAQAVKNLSGSSSSAPAPSITSDAPSSTPTDLHTKCLVDATELECCFCQSNDDEEDDDYLCFLAHPSSSSVLRDLGLISSDDAMRPWLSANMHFCGHAAHPKCVHRHHQHLNSMRGFTMRELMFARRGYRGMAYLGASEFACPLCSRTCTALSAVPRYLSGPEKSTQSTHQDDYFQDMCNSAAQIHSRNLGSSPFPDFLQTVVNASIGFSANTDDSALWSTDALEVELKSRLNNEEVTPVQRAALVSDYLSAHAVSDMMYQEVVLIRAGRPFTINRYQSLLSTLVSLSAAGQASAPGHHNPLMSELGVPKLATIIAGVVSRKRLDETVLQQFVVNIATQIIKESHLKTNIPDLSSFVHTLEVQSLVAPMMTFWQHCAAAFMLHVVARSAPVEPSGDGNILFPDVFSSLVDLASIRNSLNQMLHQIVPDGFTFQRCEETAVIGGTLTPQQLHVHISIPSGLYRNEIAERILHLPSRYNTIITNMTGDNATCSVCATVRPVRPVMCLSCGHLMCLQNSTPELHSHARTCGGASVFLIVRATSFLILQTVVGRAAQTLSIYVDKYGERDESLYRGAALSHSEQHLKEFVWQWASCSWDADSNVLQHAWRNNLSSL